MKKYLILLLLIGSNLCLGAERTVVEEYDAKVISDDPDKEIVNTHSCWHIFIFTDTRDGAREVRGLFARWDRDKHDFKYYNQHMHLKHYLGHEYCYNYNYWEVDKMSYLHHFSPYFGDYVVYEDKMCIHNEEFEQNVLPHIEKL